MIPIVIIIISILLDGILTNILPYTVNNLSLFTPMFTILIPIIIYPFYLKEEKKYLITLIITGIIYDIFYTNWRKNYSFDTNKKQIVDIDNIPANPKQ